MKPNEHNTHPHHAAVAHQDVEREAIEQAQREHGCETAVDRVRFRTAWNACKAYFEALRERDTIQVSEAHEARRLAEAEVERLRETLHELVCLYELKQANPTVYELLVEEQRAAWFKAKALVAPSPDDRGGERELVVDPAESGAGEDAYRKGRRTLDEALDRITSHGEER